MLDFVIDKVNDPQFMIGLLIIIAVGATFLTLVAPLLEADTLRTRMKAVSIERDKIRARERERAKASKGSLRGAEAKTYMKQIVERFSLSSWLGTEKAKLQLMQAGYRGQQAEIVFLFSRLAFPLIFLVVSTLYVFVVLHLKIPTVAKVGIVMMMVYFGIKFPEIMLSNKISKRQTSMRRAFPDALDLMLICVESGMSIEHALRKVSQEVGTQSVALAEELTLTMAELSFLPDRRSAYENLALRTGLDAAKQISTVLIQAERYGTSLGSALRVVSDESRSNRMMEAEKKAASLPPKLTVPMVLFFLPVLFIVIITPAAIQVSNSFK